MFNSFGNILRLTSFGESHGKGVGGVIDGFPAGIVIDMDFVQAELDRRRPGQSRITTARKEGDKVEFLSGIFEGKSTGCPIGFIVWNQNQHSDDYNNLKEVYRPSHADYTYKVKYGIRDHRGGGRSSARETISRVVAGALAKLALKQLGIHITAYTSQVGPIRLEENYTAYDLDLIETNPVRCPDPAKAKEMEELIFKIKGEGDTIGGVVTCVVKGCPIGLGQPVFGKLHAALGAAMLSINAAKAFEYGDGFKGLKQKGSEQNDVFYNNNGRIETRTNHSGGIQGGISNGQDIYFRVAFKPVATVLMEQHTVNIDGVDTTLKARGRHDPCVLPRAVPIVEAMTAMTLLDHYLIDITENEPKMLEDLFSLIRIPSISAKPEHHDDMLACAERWAQLLLEAGADEALVMPSKGNPIVFGQKIVDPDAKTVLVYAHYDVMPAEPLELWKSDPFEPEIRDGHIWARGADDDKGQSFIQVKAFEYLVRNELLQTNVKFIFEGEEEIGSPSLESFCQEHKELLKADVILVSDTSMLGADLPSLTTGLRGLAYWEIEVTGPNRDLHSGHFGGAVANPINVLCQIISQVTDAEGRITVPGFYDDVEEVPQAERDMIARIPFDEEKYKKAIHVKALFGEKGYSTLERNSCRPSFDVCGIWGGYTGEGSKTVLPSKAYAKVSCRLVPHQDHHKISRLFADYILDIAPDSVQVKVTPMHGGQGYVCPITLPAYQAAEKGFEKAFGKKPLAVRRGGSIPIISTFEQVLGIKTVLMGFGLESNAIHSPNENIPLDIFRKGIEAVVEFYLNYK